MVGRDEQRRPARVLGHRLERLPELLDVAVGGARRAEQQVVAPRVPPLVGLAEADEEDARLRLRRGEHLEERLLQHGVERHVREVARRRRVERIERRLPGRSRGRERRIPAGPHREARGALAVEDPRERVPAADHRDAAAQLRRGRQPLEHRDVRIGAVRVRVDARVPGAGQDLVVAGIGEAERVRDPRGAARRGVAPDRAALRDDGPEERHQRLAARLGRRAPEVALQRGRLLDAAGALVDERGLRARENLLPPQPVDDDQDDVVRAPRRPRLLRHQGAGDQRGEDADGNRAPHRALEAGDAR
jgi:hypothetical protein